MMLYLDSTLVAPDFRTAPTIAGSNYDSSFAVARREGWPGYVGAPRLASAEIGRQIWEGFSNAAVKTTVEILGGADPTQIPRYMTYLRRNPHYQRWMAEAAARDERLGAAQRAWSGKQQGSAN
jgi:hypothetical protein